MKKILTYPLLIILISTCIFSLSGCKDDESPTPDYSIVSDDIIEVISLHDNGWIKEGKKKVLDEVTTEFEYYENGYLKHAKTFSRYPAYHLESEVYRSSNNLPVSSKYYSSEGKLYMEFEYTNGSLASKKLLLPESSTEYIYQNGNIQSITYTSSEANNQSITTFKASENTRNLQVKFDGDIMYEADYPYYKGKSPGTAANILSGMPLAITTQSNETSSIRVNTSSVQSATWKSLNEIQKLIDDKHSTNDYGTYGAYKQKYPHISLFTTDLQRTIQEEHPFLEIDQMLMGGGYFIKNYESTTESIWIIRDSLRTAYGDDAKKFELLYGTGIISRVYYGIQYALVGTIRNMPSDPTLASDIKNLAYNQYSYLTTGRNALTDGEQAKLDKVWLEFKLFSTEGKYNAGIVITSPEQLDKLFDELNNANPSVIHYSYEAY